MKGVTLKEYAKFLAYIAFGLAIITVGCIVIFYIFSIPSGYNAALAITGTVMFWVIAGGIAWGLSGLIRKLRGRSEHKHRD